MTYPKATTGPSTDETSRQVPASPQFSEIEERVLAYWQEDDTFRASVERNPAGENGSNEFVFYDGPPFANGLPHYGHLLTGYVKDVVPRFQTMRGKRVERRFGWDTHGLPAELEAMDQLGIKTRDEILEMGIGKFNAAAKASVLRYTDQWRDYVTRQARWVDFEHDYKTLDVSYMESVLWAFKTLYDKGLIYEGFRVLPYCWSDQTPLSSHELRMDEDVYQVRRDPAVTVGLRLETGELALTWTTTPWTLPSNLAIMVDPEMDYLVVESDVTGQTERYVIAEARLDAYADELGTTDDARIVQRLTGADLLGRAYTPPFSYYLGHENAHRVVPAGEFVTSDEGTGLVHSAGAFGEEDKIVTDRNDIEPVVPVAADGTFTAPVTDYAGTHVFDANWVIIDHLRQRTRTPHSEHENSRPEPGHPRPEPVEGHPEGNSRPEPVEGHPHAHPRPELVEGHPEGNSHPEHAHPRPELVEGQRTDAPATQLGSTTPGTVLLRQEMYDHSYPHCWRCREPLIYMGVSSWFVEVTRFKDRMVELNQQIDWVPPHVKDGQFGNWLANARDWSISRNRFWGSPIPVWRSDDPSYPRIDVYGSLEELEADFGVRPDDLHRPAIDELVRANPDDPTGQATMRRVPDVLDVWFDSGSMPYGQVHYPFENTDWFEHHYPGDFIVEYIGQTRGWFYTMHVLATALFDRPAFSTCLCHGIVLGSDGQKMSKSLHNYPDVSEVFDRDGADAMRWFLMSSPILRGGDLIVTENAIREGVRQVIIPLWNTWYFFTLYADAANGGEGYDATWSTTSDHVLDRYILAKLRQSVSKITDDLEAMNIAGACDEVRWFIEGLSNWYIRRSRDRFWDGESVESKQAFDTLYTVLETMCRAAAPLLPMITEEVWRGLTGQRSVHLVDWPDVDGLPVDDDLVSGMDRVRDVCTATSALRKANGLRVRLPLGRLRVAADDARALEPFTELICDELNIRSLDLVDLESVGNELAVRHDLQVNARAAGPRLGKAVQTAIKASKSGDWSVDQDGTVTSGGVQLQDGEYTLQTVVEGGAEEHQAVSMLPGSGFVILDTAVTPELAAEGVARDVVRAVQQSRRSAGLDIADRIRLHLAADDEVRAAVEQHRDLIARETLAETVEVVPGPAGQPVDLGDGRKVSVSVAKI